MKGAPELPNFITLLSKTFDDSPFVSFLHHWENIVFSIIISCIISIFFILGARKSELIPSGVQNLLEYLIETIQDFLVEILGPLGKEYVPLIGTLFIYILTMNLFGMVPFMKSPSASLNITAALAITVFCLVQYLNIKHMGIKGFLYHLAGSPKNAISWAMVPLLLPVELLTQISRPFTLALRLFGNILGEDILIGAFALFGVTLLIDWEIPIGIPLQIPVMFLAILTSFMQALVFTLLSTIYILLSVPHDESEHNH